ncbi:MAG TPA: hypothetical protein VNB90_06435 [Cytophagaceae bacterium]|jgi:ABC-type branched-subunit amino acid transport system substrate-binding protein|nr:hypothetical protein [Cytophagaceae bacterium]
MKKIYYLNLSLLIFATAILFHSCKSKTEKPVRYIAYVGRYTDKNAEKQPDNRFDRMHEYMLRQYVADLNTQNHPVNFEIKTFDCQRDPKQAAEVYKQIGADSSIVSVVDNTWGAHLAGAQEIIRLNRIPVIAINADHNFADFGKQAVFTGNNDYLPAEINSFITKVLQKKEVLFVSEEDYSLHKSFLSDFEKNGVNVKKMFTIKNSASDKQLAFDSLAALFDEAIKADPSLKKYWVVVNLHNEYGQRLLNHIDAKHTDLHLIGHAYITQTVGTFKFGERNSNELILINNPTDAVSRKIALDMEQFRKNDPELFLKSVSPMFPKRCNDAIAIIGNFFSLHKDSIPNRNSFIEYFSGLRGTSQRTPEDLYFFNEKNELIPDLYYVQYKDGKLYSFREQLNKRGEVIPNMIAGMEILDIYNLDVATNTFQADFNYWIKVDSINADAERFIIFPNMKESGSAKSLVREETINGMIYKLYKVSGLFHQDYDLKEYPFDEQEISISMEVMNSTEKLKIAFDQSAFQEDSNFLGKFKVRAWNKEKYLLTVDNRISSTMRGDLNSVPGELKKYQVFSFRLFVKRTLAGPFLEIIMPLMLIGLVAIALLFIRDLSFGNIGEVSAGTFLGIITFSIAMASLSPSTDSITRSDILFWVTFAVVLSCFLTIIICNSLYSTGHEIRELKFVKRLRLFLIVAYALACVLVLTL